jgi:hypothetical protein
MKTHTVVVYGQVPAGAKLWLTAEQFHARAHLVSLDEGEKSKDKRKLCTANAPLGFKAGEKLAIEGDLDRGLEIMFGLEPSPADKPEKAVSKAREADHAKKVKLATEAVAQAETVLDTARTSADAAATEEKAAADDAVKAAEATLVTAKADLAALAAG